MLGWAASATFLALAQASPAAPGTPGPDGQQHNAVVIVWSAPVLAEIGFLSRDPGQASATPNLDALFAAGARFTGGTQVAARGLPTAAATLTGRLPHRSGVYYHLASGPVAPEHSLARSLRTAGWATLCVGRSPLGPPEESGFEREARNVLASGSAPVARFVADFAGKQPLFLWWAPELPGGSGARELDRALGELLEALDAHGQRGRTLFAFVTNGDPPGREFSAQECGAEAMRNPLAFALGTRISPGEHAEPVTPLDLAPSVLDWLGLAPPAGSDGRSLRALAEGRPWDARALGAGFFPRQPSSGTKVPREPGRDLLAIVYRDGRWKYVLWLRDVGIDIDPVTERVALERSAGDQSLFDLEADPREEEDLAQRSEHAERLAALRAAAVDWWRARDGPGFPMPFLSPPLGPPPAGPRPNIVLVVADDMDFEHLGFMGNARVKTPALDELARTGVVFPVAHVPMSRCRPSLAALLSGRWPQQSGIFENESTHVLARRDSLPNLLKAAGYATFQGGKFWEGSPLSMGFLEPKMTDTVFKSFVRQSQDELFAFIDRYHAERPLFVWWAPMLPHGPFDPPERLRALFRDTEVPVPPGIADARAFQEAERTAYAMGAWLDEGLAALRAKLEQAGELADTLFVFLIDNGYANGSPSKGSVFEKGLRTPVVFSWPKTIQGGRTRPELVSSLDVYPTLLGYAGVQVPAGIPGIDLGPALAGRELATRDVLFGAVYEHAEGARRLRAEDAVYALYARSARWKFVLHLRRLDPKDNLVIHEFAPFPARARGERDLYDLEADPHERRDLAGDPAHAELMDELQEGCLAWWRESGGGELDLPAGPSDNPGPKKPRRK